MNAATKTVIGAGVLLAGAIWYYFKQPANTASQSDATEESAIQAALASEQNNSATSFVLPSISSQGLTFPNYLTANSPANQTVSNPVLTALANQISNGNGASSCGCGAANANPYTTYPVTSYPTPGVAPIAALPAPVSNVTIEQAPQLVYGNFGSGGVTFTGYATPKQIQQAKQELAKTTSLGGLPYGF